MNRYITLQTFQRYFEAGKLGSLKVEIPECPDCREMKVNLDELFRHSTGIKFFEYQTRPEDIVSMCVFGSSLYKHFPKVKKEIKGKKWILFGKEVLKGVYEIREAPEDFDVMVVTKEGLTDDKLIIPQTHTEGNNYGSWQVVDHSAVETKRLIPDDYGYIEIKGGKNLHIVYRSVEQLLNGLGKGDTVSESVVRYGVPIIGQERFGEMVGRVTSPKREPLHQVEWTEDLEGKLQGKII